MSVFPVNHSAEPRRVCQGVGDLYLQRLSSPVSPHLRRHVLVGGQTRFRILTVDVVLDFVRFKLRRVFLGVTALAADKGLIQPVSTVCLAGLPVAANVRQVACPAYRAFAVVDVVVSAGHLQISTSAASSSTANIAMSISAVMCHSPLRSFHVRPKNKSIPYLTAQFPHM